MNEVEIICLVVVAIFLIFTCGTEILALILALVFVGGLLFVCGSIGEGLL